MTKIKIFYEKSHRFDTQEMNDFFSSIATLDKVRIIVENFKIIVIYETDVV